MKRGMLFGTIFCVAEVAAAGIAALICSRKERC